MINDDEEDDITSTQMMIEDSRARRELVARENKIKFACDKCEYNSGSKNMLKRHMKTQEKENLEEVARTEVDKEPGREHSAEIREKEKKASKSNRKKYEYKRINCEQCDRKFNKIETFITHMRNVHKVVPEVMGTIDNPPKTNTLTQMTLRNLKSRENTTKTPSNAQEPHI